MISHLLYEQLLREQRVEFLLCNEQLQVVLASVRITQFLDRLETAVVGENLINLFPELLGLEDALMGVYHGDRSLFYIEKIARLSPQQEHLYLTLGFYRYELGLLVSVVDVTKEGMLEQRITQQRNELGLLAQQLAQAKESIQTLLHRYVPREVAELMLANPDQARPGGVRQEVTILFADLRNFTHWAEHLDPATMMTQLNKKLTVAVEIIQAYGGIVDKFMGDAVMGLFNAPEADPEHVWHGAQAGLALVQAMREEAVSFSVGVNTGIAILGNLGTYTMMNYTAVGDAVNQAKRIQEMAPKGHVYLGTETYKAIANRIDVISLGEQTLRGREQLSHIYELIDIKSGDWVNGFVSNSARFG